ncbi:hypothetical protein HDU92_007979 [Lobulomyces angularis]|nr:hypothetical protein HDU92_007979 [Lobulomyces angularis]
MSKKPTARGVTSSFQTSQKATSLKYPVLHPSSASDHQLKTLKTNLIKWINNLIKPLHVKDITNDMADGQILACLIESLTGDHIVEWETTTSEKGKGLNFMKLVKYLKENLNISEDTTWSRMGIYERDHSSILKLLVNLSHVVGANLNLPSNVSIAVMKSITLDGVQKNKTTINEITADESLFRVEKTDLLDEFDEFVNDQLNPIKIQVNNLMEDLENGINLIILTGIVGNFFVQIDYFNQNKTTKSLAVSKLENVKFALSLMSSIGINVSKFSASDIVKKDVKGILRVVYALFEKFTGDI